MNGQELIDIISKDPALLYCDIRETIKYLLKRRLINPSALIDAQIELMAEEQYRTRCHFEDAVVSTIQLFGGNFNGLDYEKAKRRLFYNTSFSKQFPNMSTPETLSDEDKQYWSDFFERIYGFRPEEE